MSTETIDTQAYAASPQETQTLINIIQDQSLKLEEMANNLSAALANASSDGHGGFLVMGLTIFVLACFVGYYVVWKVTPALHSPLMGITNAISSVIIVGAILAAGPMDGGVAKLLGFLGITLASVNIFGGFIITRRMLSMFKKKGA